jgi:hypothetical protein
MVNWSVAGSRAPCNGRLQTPPGPEGSNGSGLPSCAADSPGSGIFAPARPHVSGHRQEIPAAIVSPNWSARSTSDHARERHHPAAASRTAISSPGQRGTGKTTVARILARCLNCVEGPTATPCGVCSSCLEITAGNAPSTSSKSTPPPTAASTKCANCAKVSATARPRPLQGLHHRRSPPDHQRSLQRAAEDPRRAARVGGFRPLHHGSRTKSRPPSPPAASSSASAPSASAKLVARMRVDLQPGRHRAEPEALAVLAQAGEGSVRDSLSALDQAIACCGTHAQTPPRSGRCSACFRSMSWTR